VDAFFSRPSFEGGRHERRVHKMEPTRHRWSNPESADHEIAQAIELERLRQQENIETSSPVKTLPAPP